MKRLLLVLLFLPLVSAHGENDGFLKAGEYMDHGKEAGAHLESGEWQNYTLAFEGGPMWEGWFFVIYGDSQNETTWTIINHNATIHGEITSQWTWDGMQQRQIGRFPAEGVYELRVQNTGNSDATIRWAYDQSCQCSFKPMPFSGAYAWFNTYLDEGQSLTFFPGPIVVNATDPTQTRDPLRITGEHATWSGFGNSWDTFNIHARGEITDSMTITARESGIQYILLQMETPDDARGGLLYHAKIEEKAAPGLGLGLVVGLLAIMLLRRR